MADDFHSYLEKEGDGRYYKMNTLAYYYEELSKKKKELDALIDQVKAGDAVIVERLQDVDDTLTQRLAEWDGKIDSFPDDVTTLLGEWAVDGTLDTVIQTGIVDEKLAPVVAHLAETVKKGEGELNDFNETTRAVLLGLEKGEINAVLGQENVREFNVANRAITSHKRTPRGGIGSLIIGGSSTLPNLDLVNKKLTIYPSAWVTYDSARYTVSVETSIPLFLFNGNAFANQILVYNVNTGLFRFLPSSSQDRDQFEIELMSLSLNSTTTEVRSKFSTFDFTVNGVLPLDSKLKKEIDESVSQTEFGIMLFGDPGDKPVFDFDQNKLTLPHPLYIHHNKKRYMLSADIPDTVVTLPTARNFFIYFNKSSYTFNVFTSAQVSTGLSENDILIATVFQSKVTMIGDFSGGENSTPIEHQNINYQLLDIPVSGLFDTNEIYDDYSNFASATASDVEDMFDTLMAQYPAYITKEFLGNEATGLPLNAYHAKPKLPDSNFYGKTPKVFINCGIHGYEHANTLATYLMLKQMCEKWSEYPHLELLRFNVEFIIVPVANPYGWNNFIRHNSNRVDLNRNFTAGWELTDSTANFYGGASPASELETQYLEGLMNRHKDIDIMYDFHNFAQLEPADRFIWIPTARDREQRLAVSLITAMTRKWSKDFDFVDANTFVGFTNNSGKGGTISAFARNNGAMFSSTLEIRDRWVNDTGAPNYSQNVCKAGVETLTNWLMINLNELVR